MDILPYEGRLSRKTYAIFLVVCWILTAVAILALLWGTMNLSNDLRADLTRAHPELAWPRMPWAVALALTVISGLTLVLLFSSWISHGIGRLHDLGCPAWTVLVAIAAVFVIPGGVGGWLVNALLVLIPGTAGANRYGPDPRGSESAAPG